MGDPKTPRHKQAIQSAQINAARDRRVGQFVQIETSIDDGSLIAKISRRVAEARKDWDDGKNLTKEQVGFINRLSSILYEE